VKPSHAVLVRLAVSVVCMVGPACAASGATLVTAAPVPDPCEITPVRPVEELLGGPARHAAPQTLGFVVPGSRTADGKACTFRDDPQRAGAEVVVRVGDDRAAEFMGKLSKERMAPIEGVAADEAYWYREGQAVFIRKGAMLLAVHVVREDGIDRAAQIKALATTIAASL
jgi:hypothetical protein